MSLSRRELFAMFRRPAAPAAHEAAVAAHEAASAALAVRDAAPAALAVRDAAPRPGTSRDRLSPSTFSLDTFYARRSAAPGAPVLGPFPVRCDHGGVPSTRIGAGVIGGGRTSDTVFASTEPPRMAAARLDPGWLPEVIPERCLARSFCTTCIERCPTPGAIAFAGASPRVDPARCDGCGVCVMVCPAPTLAFQLVRREVP